jgi:peptidoglycan/xylan/chitin deacetylase (PgdA/CDA1 family)
MGGPKHQNLWPDGKTRAISLTYDGTTSQHLDLVIPLLDQLSLRATFFANPTRILDNPIGWKSAGIRHEIGNHSLHEVADGGTLLNWNLSMVLADVRMTQALITDILGHDCKSFALPGWSTACAEGDYLDLIRQFFPFVRSARREVNHWDGVDLGYVGSFPMGYERFESGGWTVLTIGKIEDVQAHETFIRGLATHEGAWIAPFSVVAERIQNLQNSLERL